MSRLLRRYGPQLRYAAFAVILGVVAYKLAKDWHKVGPALQRLSVASLLEAFVVGFLAVACSVPAWRELLGQVDPQHRLPFPVAIRIFLLGQLGKYIPGSVWVVVAQTELGRRYGVPRQASATAGLLSMGVSLGTALVTAGAFLPFGSSELRHRYWWLTLLALVVLVCLSPPIVNPVVRLGLRLLKRPEMQHSLTWRGMAIAGGWSVSGWVLYGVHAWLLARALGGTGGGLLLPRSIGAFALSWSIGFLVFFAPGGAGPRDIALSVAYRGVIPGGGAALALISRLLLTVADLLGGAIAVVLGRREPSTGAAGEPPLSPTGPEPVVTTAG